MNATNTRVLAVVTGASSGIALELVRQFAGHRAAGVRRASVNPGTKRETCGCSCPKTVALSGGQSIQVVTISVLTGLVLLVIAVHLSTPSLVAFLVSDALVGAGAVYKGTTGLVLEAAAPEDRLALTSQLIIALYVGLSIPLIGAGVALD
jgi:NAD(P)-dependent dehydrogenase (short-subunit alcohol dehydrogenase family)